jgi:hypothetical protein
MQRATELLGGLNMNSARLKDRRKSQEITLRITNSKQNDVSFVMEPWGEVYPFAPGDDLVVIFRSPANDVAEIDFGDDTVTAYGWPGSTVQLFRNGEELGTGLFERTPVPEAP